MQFLFDMSMGTFNLYLHALYWHIKLLFHNIDNLGASRSIDDLAYVVTKHVQRFFFQIVFPFNRLSTGVVN